jgi:hypothetical protein
MQASDFMVGKGSSRELARKVRDESLAQYNHAEEARKVSDLRSGHARPARPRHPARPPARPPARKLAAGARTRSLCELLNAL